MKKDNGKLSNTNRNKKRTMSIFVIAMTFYFIILTLPSSIAGGFFLSTLLSTDVGSVILFACDCLTFTYHGFNIFVLYFLNKKFKKEFKTVFSCKKSKKIQTTEVNITSSNS